MHYTAATFRALKLPVRYVVYINVNFLQVNRKLTLLNRLQLLYLLFNYII